MTHRVAAFLSFFALPLLAVACGGGDGADSPTDPTDGQPTISRVEVTPGADTATALGDQQQYEAAALTSGGDTVTGVSFNWQSSNEAVATVNDGGVVEAVADGEAEIRASAEGVTGSAAMAVIQQVSSVSISPSSATLTTVGDTVRLTASAADANGNPVSDADLVWQSENHAVATVDSGGLVTSRGNGETSITATAQDVPAHATLTVNQAIDRLAFRTEPTSATAGEAVDPAVQVAVLDSAGNVVENAESAVTLSLGVNPGGGTLGGVSTVSAVNGVATFSNVWVDMAAAGYTLEASVSGVSSTEVSRAFDVSAAAADQLAFINGPSDATAGQTIDPAVQVEVHDAFGNTVTSASATVIMGFGSSPNDAVLDGTTSVNASNGLASFSDLSVEKADSAYTLEASASGLDSDLSESFRITPAAASQLVFVTDPSDAEGQEPISPALEVAVQDEFGNRVTSSTATITVTLGSDPTGGEASLSGTTSVTASSGFATFGDLSIALPGNGFTLEGTGSGFTATSAPFDVNLTFAQTSAGASHTCGVTTANHAYCWGGNDVGQLGDGMTTLYRSTPVAVSSAEAFTRVTAGSNHTCGVTTADDAYCWGDNADGQLGDGTTTDRPTPVPVSTTETFTQMSAGHAHTCAVTTSDEAYCWGLNFSGELGDGTTTARTTPVAVSTTEAFTQVSAGAASSCGVTTADDAFCWGNNSNGELGDGTTTNRTTPVAVSTTASFELVSAGTNHACGVTTADDALCWGENADGQLGDGTITDRTSPVPVSTSEPFGHLSAGANHTCGTTTADEPYCWGDNTDGQLGDGTNTGRTSPGSVSTTAPFSRLSAGSDHVCGTTAVGEAYCWGSNFTGQLGDGSTIDRLSPVLVVQ